MKTNAMLQQSVMDQLSYEPSLDVSHLQVVANHGVITLTGSVATYPQQYAAQCAAERVDGVKAVNDETEVNPMYKTSDHDIATAAANAVERDVLVPNGSVQITVDRGWVILEGSVDHNFQRMAAEDAVRHINGVIAVNNRMSSSPHSQHAP
jgi:osmotically-inducible protein OsmY